MAKLLPPIELNEHRHSPPKLEIRSVNSSFTPALKPQAVSDNEMHSRPRLARGHSRTQSAVVQGRPMTAPGASVTEQQQTLREMEIIQNLLRESTARDSMAQEIKDLTDEIAELVARNERLSKGAKIAPKPDAESDAARERAIAEKLRKTHEGVLESLKATHRANISSLESMHTAELSRLRSELETQRKQSSRLEGVESKIEAVEEALRESRKRAMQGEHALQQTMKDKEDESTKLSTVVKALKQEIDRCQVKLNEDVAKQAKEKKQAENSAEQLRKELEEERKRSATTAQTLAREKVESDERFSVTMRDTRAALEHELKMLKEAAESAEAASQRSKEELEIVREQDGKQLEQFKTTIKSLEGEIQQLKDSHLVSFKEQRRRTEASEETVNDLRAQLHSLEQLRDSEREANEELERNSRGVIEELRHRLNTMQQDGSNSSQVLEDLQAQMHEWEETKKEVAGKHDNELAELRTIIRNLQADSVELSQEHVDVLARKDDDARQLSDVVNSLQSEAVTMHQQLDDAKQTQEEKVRELNETIVSLTQEASALERRAEEQAAAKDKESSDLDAVIKGLQVKSDEYRQAAEEATLQIERDTSSHSQVIESLQDQLQVQQHRMQDDREAREAVKREVESMKQTLRDLTKENCSLLAERTRLLSTREQDEACSAQKEARTEELVTLLADAQAAKTSAESSLSSLQGEMVGLQKVLDTFEQDVAEKEANHTCVLATQKSELEERHLSNVQSLRNEHARILDEKTKQHSSELNASSDETRRRVDSLLAEKQMLTRQLNEITLQHDGELEEKSSAHAAACRDLQNALMQVEERQTAQLSEQSRKHDAAASELQDAVDRLETDHEHAIKTLSAEHEVDAQALMEKHAAQLAQVEEEAAHRVAAAGAERDRIHQIARAALEAEHAEDLNTLVSPNGRKVKAPVSERRTPAKGLSHVFVNRDTEVDAETPGLAETPLACASEDEHEYSPTPAYPKDGRRAGAHVLAARRIRSHELEKENAELVAALRSAKNELKALKSSRERSVKGESAGRSPKHVHDGDDPFALHMGNRSPRQSRDNVYKTGEWDGSMTLEGTLESIRVQTEQLLEINDDFIADQRRWSLRMGRTRSDRSTPLRGYGSSPRGPERSSPLGAV